MSPGSIKKVLSLPEMGNSHTQEISVHLKLFISVYVQNKLKAGKSFLSASAPQSNGEDTAWILMVPGAE